MPPDFPAIRSDLLEFQKIEYDAGFAPPGLLLYTSSCNNPLFFSFFMH